MQKNTLIYDGEPITLMLTRYDENYGGGLCITALDKNNLPLDNLTWNLFPNPMGILEDDEVAIEKCNEDFFTENKLGEFDRSVSEGYNVYYIMKLNWDELNKHVSVSELENTDIKNEYEDIER